MDRQQGHQGRARRPGIGLAAAALALAPGAAAVAATSSYTLSNVAVPKSVEQRAINKPPGKGFTVAVKGFAQKQSALDVYLDYRKCPASATKEAKRDSLYQAGYSYFVGPSSVTGVAVKGAFNQSFTAHPGNITGKRYVCAYLTTASTPISTRAHASATYQVTK